jgi:hypothetical protein
MLGVAWYSANKSLVMGEIQYSGTFWFNLTATNANGTGWKNWTITVTWIQPPAADNYLAMSAQMSLLVFLIGAGCIFILVTYVTLRKR